MRPAARGSIVRIFKRLRGAAKRRARRLARQDGARASPGDRYFSALAAKPPDCLTNFFFSPSRVVLVVVVVIPCVVLPVSGNMQIYALRGGKKPDRRRRRDRELGVSLARTHVCTGGFHQDRMTERRVVERVGEGIRRLRNRDTPRSRRNR